MLRDANTSLLSGALLALLLSACNGGGSGEGQAGSPAQESCAACLYVSTAGSDSNPGSYSSPFLTIQHAASVAVPGQTVFIRGGTYREAVTPALSGTSPQPITYAAYSGEAVTISGAEQVTGWSLDAGAVYGANMNWNLRPAVIPSTSSDSNPVLNNQVFVDGKMMVEARFPNVDATNISLYPRATLASVSGDLSAGTAVTATASGLNGSANFYQGAWLSVLPGGMWLAIPARVTASSGSQLSLSFFQTESSGYYHPQAGNLFYLEGTKNLLDSPGEWFLDPSSATLYVMTPDQDSPSSHVVEAKRRDIAFDLRGKSHIVIKNLKIFAARIVTDDSSSDNTLDSLDMEYVSHNVLRRASAEPRSGVYFAGSRNSLINSQVRHCSHTCVTLAGNSHLVRNNVINDANYIATYDSAIGVRSGASDVVIESNTISDTGRSAIDMSSGYNSSRIKILNNTIFNTMLLTTDGGAIYTYANDGGGAEIAYNLIYNTRDKMLSSPNGGIYLDNGSTGFKVHHNVVANTEYGINLGLPTTSVSTSNMVHKVYHNTLSSSYFALIASTPGGLDRPGNTATGTEVINNIGQVTEISSYLTSRGGIVSNNANPSQAPNFIDADTLDFGLQSSSTAVIDTGTQIAGESYAMAGTSPDEGAYEYSLPRWVSGATRSSPSAPANLALSGIGQTGVTLSWNAVSTVSHYTVERATRFKTNPYRQLVRVPAGTTTVTFNDLVANTPYFYRVRAVDRFGNYSPITAATPLRTVGTTSAASVFQGESHDAMVDGAIVNNNSAIGYLRANTSSLVYRNVDFSSHPSTLTTRIGSNTSAAGNTIEFRAGSATGALIASITVPTSGGIIDRSVSADTAALAVADVYVLFKGPTANWNFGAFDSFAFSP